MTEYLIFFNDEWVTETSDAGWQQRARDARAVTEAAKAAGVYLFGGGLDNEAPVFHVEPGADGPVFTDGPYAETKEVFGGFLAVDVPDEEAARSWAGKVAVACDWPQEVRVLQPTPDRTWPDIPAHVDPRPVSGGTEYLVLFYDGWVTQTDPEGWERRSHDVWAVVGEMKAAGVYLLAGGLDNEGPVFHVQPGADGPVFTDGPYAETKEVFGGFTAVDVPDEEAARYWAGRVAVACDWPQEVRIFRRPNQTPTPEADAAAAAAEVVR